MFRWVVSLLTATVMAGSLVLPAAAGAPAFSLTLFPAKVVVPLGQSAVSFGLLNSGSEAQRVVVSAEDGWITTDAASFDLQPGERHTVEARITLPARHD